MRASVWLRSAAFLLVQVVATPVYSVVALLTFPFSPLTRYRIISSWSRLMMWSLERVCGVRYRVLGAENIPGEPFIVLAKHESAWETLAFQLVLPPQVWVIKRELLWIPFFGWGLAMLSPIAIDRRDGWRALRQTLDQGRERLASGFNIVIFPEGTRSAPGVSGRYQAGGAWLALQTGAPIVPIAHNAGDHWPRNSFLKYPGVVTISIGPVVRPADEKAPELARRIGEWIENETRRIRSS
jgi:1-acyl-sn-glycerol-3-phosphate acyltransferase